jgi:putative DNA primase/helicase
MIGSRGACGGIEMEFCQATGDELLRLGFIELVSRGAIRLHHLVDPDKPLAIGEGIETAASAGRLMGFPAWAAISAGNLAAGLVLPPEAHQMVIAVDPDDVGRKAAREAWTRWKAEGRNVRIAVTNGAGDFNDLLLAREVDHVA